MPPSLLSDAARVTLDRPAEARADLRADAMLLTHGRAGTEPAIAAALLIDAIRSGHLDVLEPPRLVPPPDTPSSPTPRVAPAGHRPRDRRAATPSAANHRSGDRRVAAGRRAADAASAPATHPSGDRPVATNHWAAAASSPATHPSGDRPVTTSHSAAAASSPATHPSGDRPVAANHWAPAPSSAATHRPRELRVVAGRSSADEPLLLADLRARVLTAPTGSPLRWIERTAEFAPHRIATELVTAGIAMPLSPRFARTFTLSVNARAEAAARARISTDPALAVILYACGLPTGDPLPPSAHSLPFAERTILAALRDYARTTTLTTADFPAA